MFLDIQKRNIFSPCSSLFVASELASGRNANLPVSIIDCDRLQIEEEANNIRIVDGRTSRQFKSKAAKVSCEIFARRF